MDKPDLIPRVAKVFPVIECPLLCYFYYLSLEPSKTKKAVLLISGIVLCSVFAYDLLTNKQKAPFVLLSLEGFMFSLIILYYFYEKVKNINDIPIYSLATFWISLAFLLNFTGTFFLYLFAQSMKNKNDSSFQEQYYIIYGFFTILKNVLLCIGIFVNRNAIVPQKTTFIEPNLELDRFHPITKKKP